MLDEVDILHVERNKISGDDILSYIGYIFLEYILKRHLFAFVPTDRNFFLMLSCKDL